LQTADEFDEFALQVLNEEDEESVMFQNLLNEVTLSDFCSWIRNSKTFEPNARKLFER
jgi:hypothetical protein